jgi:hypothetical protein
MKRKKGKMVSVYVQPFQSACSSGGYTADHVPGLFTRIIPAIVPPRRTSSESSRSAMAFVMEPL